MYIYERAFGGLYASEYQLGEDSTPEEYGRLVLIGEFDEFYPEEFIAHMKRKSRYGIVSYRAKYFCEFLQDNFEFAKKTYIYLFNTDIDTQHVIVDRRTGWVPHAFCPCLELIPELLSEIDLRGDCMDVRDYPILISAIDEKLIYEIASEVPHVPYDEYYLVDPKNIIPPEGEEKVLKRYIGGVDYED